MAKKDDWETLMNGAFGRKNTAPTPSAPISLTLEPDAAKEGTRAKAKVATKGKAKTASRAADPADPFAALTAALETQQKNINAQLKAQQEMLKNTPLPDLTPLAGTPTADAVTPTASSTKQEADAMLAALEQDGLLATGTKAVPDIQRGSFAGLADELKEIVLGQDTFVDSLVRAARRPFVLGTEGTDARNVVLISGGEGTGRHFALPPLVEKMAARGLLQNANIFTLDLSLYADSGSEKIFLQDLYAALHASGDVVVFEGYEQCHPSFLKTLAALATTGSAPLNSRYILNKEGILIDAGTALAPNAIRTLDPCGNYLFFYSKKGKASVADHFGAGMVAAIGDFCTTAPFAPAALAQIADNHLKMLSTKAMQNLGFALATDDAVRDFIAAQAHEASGANGILSACDKIYRALSEYCLALDTLPEGSITLSVAEGMLQFAPNDAAPTPLFDLLPVEYQGSRATTEA